MIKSMNVEEFFAVAVKEKVFFIDVRERDEYNEVHAKGAQSFPLSGLDPQKILEEIGADKKDPLYLICRSGKRSMTAAQQFAALGCTNLTNIEGGTLAWIDANLPADHGY